jgi:hypothetical protein
MAPQLQSLVVEEEVKEEKCKKICNPWELCLLYFLLQVIWLKSST